MAARQAQVLQAKDDLFLHRLAKHLRRRILKDQPGALRPDATGGRSGVQAIEPDVALKGAVVQVGDQTGQAAGQCALAAARWSGDEEALPDCTARETGARPQLFEGSGRRLPQPGGCWSRAFTPGMAQSD